MRRLNCCMIVAIIALVVLTMSMMCMTTANPIIAYAVICAVLLALFAALVNARAGCVL